MLAFDKLELTPLGWEFQYQWDGFEGTLHKDKRVFEEKSQVYVYWASMCWYYIIQRFEQMYLVAKANNIILPAWRDDIVDMDCLHMANQVLNHSSEINYSSANSEVQAWFTDTIIKATKAAKEMKAICERFNINKSYFTNSSGK